MSSDNEHSNGNLSVEEQQVKKKLEAAPKKKD